MSIKESIRRRGIRNHGYVTADCICSQKEHEEGMVKKAVNKEKIKTSLSTLRRIPLMQLDKSTKTSPEKRIENINTFLDATLKAFENEYSSLTNKDENALRKLLFLYKTHIKQLLDFDKKTNNTKKLTEKFIVAIAKIDTHFITVLKQKENTKTL